VENIDETIQYVCGVSDVSISWLWRSWENYEEYRVHFLTLNIYEEHLSWFRYFKHKWDAKYTIVFFATKKETIISVCP